MPPPPLCSIQRPPYGPCLEPHGLHIRIDNIDDYTHITSAFLHPITPFPFLPLSPLPPQQQEQHEMSELTNRFQTRPTNKKPVNILLRRQIPTILLANTSTINNPCVVRCFLRNRFGEPFADRGVDFLRLGGGCDFACAYCPGWVLVAVWNREGLGEGGVPNRFISDDDLGPVFDFLGDGGELLCYDVGSCSGFALLEMRMST